MSDALAPLGVWASTGDEAAEIDPAVVPELEAKESRGDLTPESIQKTAVAKDPNAGGVGGQENMNRLEKSGWAVLFGRKTKDEIKANLKPLLDHRQAEIKRRLKKNPDDVKQLFKVFDGKDCPKKGESARQWLGRQGDGIEMDNDVKPMLGVPYYVMIVGAPDDIPFDFQYELDMNWGVGRLWLENPEDYALYAQSVIDYETKPVTTSAQLAVFATNNGKKADGGATKLVCDNLAKPMAEMEFGSEEKKFGLKSFIGADATKETLNKIWTGDVEGGRPSMLLTGSHGLLCASDDDRLPAIMGSIMCQDWKGGPPEPKHYCSAADLPKNASVHGLVHFMLCCFGAGWPEFDNYSLAKGPKELSPKGPMMARLPQALLGRANGVLAVVGHIDMAFPAQFIGDNGQPQNQDYQTVLDLVSRGYRVGNAMDQFNTKWTKHSARLLGEMSLRKGKNEVFGNMDAETFAREWVLRNDARNYVVLGDPAVRLRVEAM
jgi:hypothetical protein